MDYLKEFYALFSELETTKLNEVEAKDELSALIGTPDDDSEDTHPEAEMKAIVDDEIALGKTAPEAHERVYGKVNTHDIGSKADFAKTLGRLQNDSKKGHVSPDKDGSSIYAVSVEKDKQDEVGGDRLRTPIAQEEYITDEDNLLAEDLNYLKLYGKL